MEKDKMKTYSLEEVTDKIIGKRGSKDREVFEYELRMDLLGETIRKTRKKRGLTQSELGEIVGVKKSQISKLENSFTDARLDTIIKVFNALNARVTFNVDLLEEEIEIA